MDDEQQEKCMIVEVLLLIIILIFGVILLHRIYVLLHHTGHWEQLGFVYIYGHTISLIRIRIEYKKIIDGITVKAFYLESNQTKWKRTYNYLNCKEP